MKRNVFNLAFVIIPVALLLIAARLTSGGSHLTAAPAVPAIGVELASAPAEDTAVFAGGCFWGIEAVFDHVKGVKQAISGYAGGQLANPSYEQVSSEQSGHAESVEVIYDPAQVSYGKLLQIFFSVAHDPTQLNRQGPDHGPQYRSAIFYRNAEQKRVAESYIKQLSDAKTFSRPIVTQVAKLPAFYRAEEYHQNYLERNPNQPYIVINDRPKVEALRTQFAQLWRD